MGNFPEFISKAYKKHSHESGGILVIPPYKQENTKPTHPCNTKLSGVNFPQLLIMPAQSYTGIHVENLNFASVNFLHDSKPKYWIM